MIPRHRLAALAALALAAQAGGARAQKNYQSSPLGGMSALMGNTGVALAKDGAAPFLNPATIGRIDDAKFAFSVNMYSASIAHYRDWHAPAGVDRGRFGAPGVEGASETQTRLDVLPSTLCFFFTLRGFGRSLGDDAGTPAGDRRGPRGREKLALCLGTTERSVADYPALNFRSASGATQAQSFSRSWARFQAGPTFSSYVTDDLALGISVHGSYASYEAYWSSTNVATDTRGAAVASSFAASANAHAFDLGVIGGLTYRTGRGSHIGVSIMSQAGSPWGTFSANESSTVTRPDQARTSIAHGDFAAPLPFRLAVGYGVEWPRLRVETNLVAYAPWRDALTADLHVDEIVGGPGGVTTSGRDVVARERARAVLNSAMGFEYTWTPGTSLLGGVATDFSAAERLAPRALPTIDLLHQDQVSRAIGSAGVRWHGKTAEILLGAQLAYGWGKAYALNDFVVPSRLEVVDLRTYSGVFIIGGSADLRAFGEAVRDVERAVVPKRPHP